MRGFRRAFMLARSRIGNDKPGTQSFVATDVRAVSAVVEVLALSLKYGTDAEVRPLSLEYRYWRRSTSASCQLLYYFVSSITSALVRVLQRHVLTSASVPVLVIFKMFSVRSIL